MPHALLLNASYEPLCVVSQRRAVVLILSDKAVTLDGACAASDVASRATAATSFFKPGARAACTRTVLRRQRARGMVIQEVYATELGTERTSCGNRPEQQPTVWQPFAARPTSLNSADM